MRYSLTIIVAAVLTCAAATALAGKPALLEFQQKGKTYRGKLVAHDEDHCWLMARDGQLSQLRFRDVSKFRRVSPRFERFTAAELRDQLRREFGKEYDVTGTEHYLVCAARGRVRAYCRLFEDVYRQFYIYFSTRGLPISQPEFPLVAIVFPDRKSFHDYCRKDGFPASTGLAGYYLTTTNRIALSGVQMQSLSGDPADPSSTTARVGLSDLFRANDASASLPSPADLQWSNNRWAPTVAGNVKDTIIHEATHQVAYNTGLHSRIGENPRWVVEGLATVFEAPGTRQNSRNLPAKTRINRERYIRFGSFVKRRRKPKSLAAFVGSDEMFRTRTLDAYSQAWALSFFLIDTRPAQYARYLKTIATRDPFEAYTAPRRVADFKQAFGADLDWLDVRFLRFVERLN